MTRRELFAALADALQRNGIQDPIPAVEVLGPPDHAVPVFGIILSEPAKTLLTPALMEVTRRLHPTIADVWLLSGAESAALIESLTKHQVAKPHQGSEARSRPTELTGA